MHLGLQSSVEPILDSTVRLIRTELRTRISLMLILFSVILDSDGSSCQRANFNIGASTATTRSWDIYVTQVK